MPRLVIEKGPDQGREVKVTAATTLLVGREATGGLRIRDSWASRRHFRIEHRPEGFYIVDLQSLNGTFLNGRRIVEARLQIGDLIQVGETLFSFAGEKDEDPLLNRKIAGYRFLERIGRGGMGTVYKAEQVDLQRVVAVKVISREYAQDRAFIDRFIREACAAAALNHPNIVQVYDVKKAGDLYFFSMEYMPGGSIQQKIRGGSRLPPDEAVRAILDAARGLAYAHGKGMVHRDVKPDNMMIAEDGTVKVGDMGLAARAEEIAAEGAEQKYILGTPHYIAPEQLDGKPADFRSDIYALGSSLYRLLAGVTPFTGQSAQEIVRRKLREDPKPVHEVAPEVPLPLGQLVMRMMARDPAQRPARMEEVISALEEFRTRARPARVPGPIAWIERHRRAAVAGAIGTLLIMGTLVIFALGRGGTTVPPGGGTGSPAGPDRNTGGTDEDVERLALEADNFYLRNKDQWTKEALEECRRRFAALVERRPEHEKAPEWHERISEMERRLAAYEAETAFQAADVADRNAWNAFVREWTQNKISLDLLDPALAAYASVQERFPGTPAAEDAASRRAHIERWRAAFVEEQDRWDRYAREIDGWVRERRWADAVRAVERYAQDAPVPPEGPYPKGDERYATLFFAGQMAPALRENILRMMSNEWRALKARVEPLVQDERYREAIDLLDEALARFGPDAPQRQEMASVRDDLVAALERKVREGEIARWEEEQRRRAEDARTVEDACLRAYEAVRAKDFVAAVREVSRARDTVRTPESRRWADRRLAVLNAALAYLNEWCDAANHGATGFNSSARIADRNGRIVEATPAGCKIAAGPVEMLVEFGRISDREYVEYMRRWRAAPPERKIGLALMMLELGMFEQGRALLEEVAGTEDGGGARAEAARWLAAWDSGDWPQSPEVLARIRIRRVEELLQQALPDWRAIQEELLALDGYRQTRAYSERRDDITRWTAEANRILRGDMDRIRRQRLREAIRARVESERADLVAAARDVLSRIASREGPGFERTMWEVRILVAIGDPQEAERRIRAHLRAEERNMPAEDRAEMYKELFHILAGTGDIQRAWAAWREGRAAVRDLGGYYTQKFDEVEEQLRAWERRLPERRRDLAEALGTLAGDGDIEPDLLWVAAERIYDLRLTSGARNRPYLAACDAAALLVALEAHFPDDVHVREGEVDFLLGDLFYACGAYRKAYDRYRTLMRALENSPPWPQDKRRTIRERFVHIIPEEAGALDIEYRSP